MVTLFPISLCMRIEKVATSKKISFDEAILFLLEKVEAPASGIARASFFDFYFLPKKVEAPRKEVTHV